jgi:alcohol dehydrogenase class IV
VCLRVSIILPRWQQFALRAMATIFMPQIMKIGAGVCRQLPDVLRKLNCKQPLLVTDAFVQKSAMMKPTESALSEAGMRSHTFAGVVPDPTTDSLVPAIELMRQTPDIDCVVGFGGGSSLDTAKVLAVLARHPGPLRQHKVPFVAERGCCHASHAFM